MPMDESGASGRRSLLTESNAICFYLANGSKLIPDGHFDQADMLRWMFWEQYNHEPNIATLRFWLRFVGVEALNDAQRMQITGKRENGLHALDLMDKYLEGRKWFVADQFSVADICLFAYTHVADEADFDIEAYPEIIRWMERIMTLDGHVGWTNNALTSLISSRQAPFLWKFVAFPELAGENRRWERAAPFHPIKLGL